MSDNQKLKLWDFILPDNRTVTICASQEAIDAAVAHGTMNLDEDGFIESYPIDADNFKLKSEDPKEIGKFIDFENSFRESLIYDFDHFLENEVGYIYNQ